MTFKRQLLIKLYVIFDMSLLFTSLYVARFGRNMFAPLQALGEVTVSLHTVLFIVALVFGWRSLFIALGLHESRRLGSRKREILDMLKTAISAALVLAAVGIILHSKAVSPLITFRFLLLSASLLISSRLLARRLLPSVRLRGHNLRSIVIAGTNARAIEFAENILARPELGYRLDGFVDDEWVGPKLSAGTVGLVCSIEDLRSYLRHHVVDEIIIALPIKSLYSKADQLVECCREQGVIVRLLSNLFKQKVSHTRVDEFESSALISFYSSPANDAALLVKRVLDVIASALLLVVSTPLLLISAILVKLDSEGPVFFAQQRVGLNKRCFSMYKLRTMVVNAEALQAGLEPLNEAGGPVFKLKHDPRVTRIGRLLRKTSIDELPQLFNVLKGDMSLVGPRPLPTRDYDGFNEDWPRRRFSVRPGITCIWQISGRSNISFEQWMILDMRYIDQWSLWLDLSILAKTIPAVVRGSGAA